MKGGQEASLLELAELVASGESFVAGLSQGSLGEVSVLPWDST